MAGKELPNKHIKRWNELLVEAVNVPGTVSKAYNLFRDYSVGNQMLAMFQCMSRNISPGGGIGTYNKWKTLERTVKKGEKAIWLCRPVTYKVNEVDEDGNTVETPRIAFKYEPRWFVYAQTEGKDYELPPLPGWDIGNALVNLEVEAVEFDMPDGNCMGYAHDRRFAINPMNKKANGTIMHELAHIVLGHTEERMTDTKDRTPRDVKEMEAEATAMLVMDALGQKDHKESRGYIQAWFRDNEVPEATARHIFAAANTILQAGREAPPAQKEA